MSDKLNDAAYEYGSKFDRDNRDQAMEDFHSGAEWMLKEVVKFLNGINGDDGWYYGIRIDRHFTEEQG